MEIVHTKGKNISPIDQEILNTRLHTATTVQDGSDCQELIALGLSKGTVIFLHVLALNKVFCRFTIHREAIELIKYLPNS